MKISDDLKIKDVQAEFRSNYPGLKLEFYKKAHGAAEGSPVTEQYSDEEVIGDIRSVHETAQFVLAPEMSVAEVEQIFEDQLGLHAQVFRKSNALWLQTSATDHWTLKEQNRKGLASEQS